MKEYVVVVQERNSKYGEGWTREIISGAGKTLNEAVRAMRANLTVTEKYFDQELIPRD